MFVFLTIAFNHACQIIMKVSFNKDRIVDIIFKYLQIYIFKNTLLIIKFRLTKLHFWFFYNSQFVNFGSLILDSTILIFQSFKIYNFLNITMNLKFNYHPL